MKKIAAILLVLTMCAGCLWAAAEEEPAKEEIPVLGITFTYPQAMIDTKGMFGFGSAALLDDGIYYDYLYYIAIAEEEIAAASDEQMAEKAAVVFYLFSISDNRDFSAVTQLVGDVLNPENAIQIGQLDGWTYYLCFMDDSVAVQAMGQEYRDEYNRISGMKDEMISACTLYVPFNEHSGMDDRTVRFTVKDLDGKEIPSSEIFAQHEITMVNIWATWCGPCVGELAELQAIHTRFLEKDCAVLGLLTDNDLSSARSLIEQNGITYQVVVAPDNFGSVFPYEVIPTSFFVDRNGVYLGTKITGAEPEKYEPMLEPLLKK